MTHPLHYAAPASNSRWPLRFRAALWAIVPASAVAGAACLLSTAAVEVGRRVEGQPTLDGLAWTPVYFAAEFAATYRLFNALNRLFLTRAR